MARTATFGARSPSERKWEWAAFSAKIVRPEKLVATEKFEDSWYAGEALDTTVFEERGGITKVKLTVLYESKEARDTATRSGMEHGMIAGYNRLEQVLASFSVNA